MKMERKVISYAIIGILFFMVLFFLYIRANKIEKGYQFSGVVQNISYGDKGTPKVVIDGETYYLTYTKEDFNNKIKPGDSLIKCRNSRIYRLVKHDSKEVIVSQ